LNSIPGSTLLAPGKGVELSAFRGILVFFCPGALHPFLSTFPCFPPWLCPRFPKIVPQVQRLPFPGGSGRKLLFGRLADFQVRCFLSRVRKRVSRATVAPVVDALLFKIGSFTARLIGRFLRDRTVLPEVMSRRKWTSLSLLIFFPRLPLRVLVERYPFIFPFENQDSVVALMWKTFAYFAFFRCLK